MKLYSMSNTCALSVHIELEWTGEEFEVELMARGDNRKQAYLIIHSRAQAPKVVLDNDTVLTEAAAILTWLIDAYLEAGLGATITKPLQRFKIAEAMSYLTGDVHLAFGPFFGPDRYSADETQYLALRTKSLEQVAAHISELNRMLGYRPYILAERSVLNAYLYVLTRWADYLPNGIRPYPNLASFRVRMESDDAVQRALKTQKLKPLSG